MAEAKKLNSWCFVCGAENPQGLHIKKLRTEHGCRCDFTVERGWCGYAGILHGGIHAAILDEIMGDAVNYRLKTAVTLDMTIRYISPGREGMALVCEGEIASVSGRRAKARGTIREAATGKLISEATGHYLRVDVENLKERADGQDAAGI